MVLFIQLWAVFARWAAFLVAIARAQARLQWLIALVIAFINALAIGTERRCFKRTLCLLAGHCHGVACTPTLQEGKRYWVNKT